MQSTMHGANLSTRTKTCIELPFKMGSLITYLFSTTDFNGRPVLCYHLHPIQVE